MKKGLFFLFIGWALFASAQPNIKPQWINNRPQTSSEQMYYYRVTLGEGQNYDKAYANAFAKAILESSWKLGVEVNTQNDLQTIESNIMSNISVEKSTMILPLNKVCEYVEPQSGRMGLRVYILWQVAKYGNVRPNFEEFTDCD